MLKGVHCIKGFVSLEEHEKCMLSEPGPPCGIPPTVLQIITRPNAEREASGVKFSPSSLSACHRQAVLKGEHDWFLDVKQAYKMVRGTIVHEGLSHEPAPPGVLGVVRELRMAAPIQTKYGVQTFHGKADEILLLRTEIIMSEQQVNERGELLTMQGRVRLYVKLTDFKTKSEVGHDLIEAEREHVDQINMYAWLIQQFLPVYLNSVRSGFSLITEPVDVPMEPHLFLNDGVELPHIDEVVVDELSITYLDMKRPRTFSSRAMLNDQGKMVGDMVNGRWRRRIPVEYEQLELLPIHHFRTKYTESKIRHGIEQQIEAEQLLAPPLEGKAAELMCRNCPVRQQCVTIGLREGYSMRDQLPYAQGETEP